MANLFSPFEEASNRYNVPTTSRPELSTTGLIHMALEEEHPMFSKLKINVLPPRSTVVKLVVINDTMLVALSTGTLLRIDLRSADKVEELEFGKPMASPMRVVSLFMDPHGYHALVSLASKHGDAQPELLYVPCRSNKLRASNRARGYEITAVGWNHNADTEASTGPILLGTSKGLIIESEFLADTDRIFQSSWEKCWRDVFDIGKGSVMPIQGIEFHRSSARSERYFVLVTTNNRLYQFVGNVNSSDDKPMLQHIFNSYLNSSIPEGYLEIPSNLKYSKLQFYYQTPKGPPKTFGWLTAVGIYHGNVDTTSPPGQDSVVAQSKMLKYPPQEEGVNPVPLSFVLTQFHALLLYPDKLVAMCLLNEEVVFQDAFSAELTGKLVGICKDIVRNFVWVYSERSIFKYKVYQEDRNMWRVYMDKGDFDRAQEFCRDNLVHKDQVLIRKAQTLFQNEKYQDSAETYAETQSSFEEVALKFLQIEQIEALKTFLCRKLEKLKGQDKTQITMIVVWVTELFLNQLGQIRDAGRESSLEYRELQEQFNDFMQARLVQDCMRNNCGTIYNLMSSHGDKENLTKFTLMNQDYERVIAHHIQKNNHLEALVILKQQGRKELFYQFAPSLMQAVPRQTVQALIEQGRGLAPSRLIPALIMSDQGENDAQASEVIRYLEFCIHKLGCQDQAIHNYILALYARLNPDKLMEYLSSQGNDISMINYDVHYALGLCRERNLTEACVQLSALLGLWEAAVDLALLVDVELAKQTAALPQNDLELRKKLWLKIAQHVVEEKDDIQQAMKFLQQCDLIKIEDILPFFSDFVTIDHFKDAICNSLQEYNRHIQDLKEEMEEATKSAEIIREEIQTFRNRYAFVSSNDNCNLCKKQLLARAFFLFPCSHRFHMDCLQTQVTPLLSTSQLSRVKDLQRQLASMTVKEDTASLGSSALTAREQVRSELDSIVAGECLYCGENMIRSIDKPFINEDEFDKILKDWQ